MEKDVKQVKLSVEGADVKITSVVLGWDNRKDATLTNLGTLKAGGQTAATDAPGRKGRLTSVKVQYEILGDKPMATARPWDLIDREGKCLPENQRDLLAAESSPMVDGVRP